MIGCKYLKYYNIYYNTLYPNCNAINELSKIVSQVLYEIRYEKMSWKSISSKLLLKTKKNYKIENEKRLK